MKRPQDLHPVRIATIIAAGLVVIAAAVGGVAIDQQRVAVVEEATSARERTADTLRWQQIAPALLRGDRRVRASLVHECRLARDVNGTLLHIAAVLGSPVDDVRLGVTDYSAVIAPTAVATSTPVPTTASGTGPSPSPIPSVAPLGSRVISNNTLLPTASAPVPGLVQYTKILRLTGPYEGVVHALDRLDRTGLAVSIAPPSIARSENQRNVELTTQYTLALPTPEVCS